MIITNYTVRRLGCTAWQNGIPTEGEAHASAARAKQVTGIAHQVYAETQDGRVIGPLDRFCALVDEVWDEVNELRAQLAENRLELEEMAEPLPVRYTEDRGNE